MATRQYISPFSEIQLWQDLNQLAEEEGNLGLFRAPQCLYSVNLEPPGFLLRKARATKTGTEYFVQITGKMEARFGKTYIDIRSGFTAEGRFRLGLAGVYFLAWPPTWYIILNPSSWKWAVPVTVFFAGILGLSLYWPVWQLHRFLVKRWKLQPA